MAEERLRPVTIIFRPGADLGLQWRALVAFWPRWQCGLLFNDVIDREGIAVIRERQVARCVGFYQPGQRG
jgi:hypothetical protein